MSFPNPSILENDKILFWQFHFNFTKRPEVDTMKSTTMGNDLTCAPFANLSWMKIWKQAALPNKNYNQLNFKEVRESVGSQVGVVVISRASHLYDPGSSPHVGWDLSISIWLRRFFSGYSGFPPSAKNRLPANSICCGAVLRGCRWAVKWLAFVYVSETFVCVWWLRF